MNKLENALRYLQENSIAYSKLTEKYSISKAQLDIAAQYFSKYIYTFLGIKFVCKFDMHVIEKLIYGTDHTPYINSIKKKEKEVKSQNSQSAIFYQFYEYVINNYYSVREVAEILDLRIFYVRQLSARYPEYFHKLHGRNLVYKKDIDELKKVLN